MIARLLTAHNAEILTATVTIKTLTVSGKQVTLAVFRQLQEEAIVDLDAMALRGVAWGWVNYYCDYRDQINLVWQLGNELRRCLIRPKAAWRTPPNFHCEAVRGYEWDPKTRNNVLVFSCPNYLTQYCQRSAALPVESKGQDALTPYRADCVNQQRLNWRALEARAERYENLVAPLFDTPQLFVAV